MAVTGKEIHAGPVVTPEDILRARSVVNEVYVDDKVKDYIIDIVFATREPAAFKLPIEDFIQYAARHNMSLSLSIDGCKEAHDRSCGSALGQEPCEAPP